MSEKTNIIAKETVDRPAETYHEIKDSIYQKSQLRLNVLQQTIKNERITYMQNLFAQIGENGVLTVVEENKDGKDNTDVLVRKMTDKGLSAKNAKKLPHGTKVILDGKGTFDYGKDSNGRIHIYLRVILGDGSRGYIASEHLKMDKPRAIDPPPLDTGGGKPDALMKESTKPASGGDKPNAEKKPATPDPAPEKSVSLTPTITGSAPSNEFGGDSKDTKIEDFKGFVQLGDGEDTMLIENVPTREIGELLLKTNPDDWGGKISFSDGKITTGTLGETLINTYTVLEAVSKNTTIKGLPPQDTIFSIEIEDNNIIFLNSNVYGELDVSDLTELKILYANDAKKITNIQLIKKLDELWAYSLTDPIPLRDLHEETNLILKNGDKRKVGNIYDFKNSEYVGGEVREIPKIVIDIGETENIKSAAVGDDGTYVPPEKTKDPVLPSEFSNISSNSITYKNIKPAENTTLPTADEILDNLDTYPELTHQKFGDIDSTNYSGNIKLQQLINMIKVINNLEGSLSQTPLEYAYDSYPTETEKFITVKITTWLRENQNLTIKKGGIMQPVGETNIDEFLKFWISVKGGPYAIENYNQIKPFIQLYAKNHSGDDRKLKDIFLSKPIESLHPKAENSEKSQITAPMQDPEKPEQEKKKEEPDAVVNINDKNKSKIIQTPAPDIDGMSQQVQYPDLSNLGVDPQEYETSTYPLDPPNIELGKSIDTLNLADKNSKTTGRFENVPTRAPSTNMSDGIKYPDIASLGLGANSTMDNGGGSTSLDPLNEELRNEKGSIIPPVSVIKKTKPVEEIVRNSLGTALDNRTINTIKTMSANAKIAYERMVGRAQDGKCNFIVADKNNGRCYLFDKKGQSIVHFPALYGRQKGDEIPDSAANKENHEYEDYEKVTPAGIFTLGKISYSDYLGSNYNDVMDDFDEDGIDDYGNNIALHPVYLGHPEENREMRLQSEIPNDNNISYGCINISNADYNEWISRYFKVGGIIAVIPNDEKLLYKYIPPYSSLATN